MYKHLQMKISLNITTPHKVQFLIIRVNFHLQHQSCNCLQFIYQAAVQSVAVNAPARKTREAQRCYDHTV